MRKAPDTAINKNSNCYQIVTNGSTNLNRNSTLLTLKNGLIKLKPFHNEINFSNLKYLKKISSIPS
jgi:hypothetical protein